MRMRRLMALLGMLCLGGAQKWNQETSDWAPKEHAQAKTCSNLSQVLDNWKFAIITQVKDLLVNDHASVLPDYNRIRPLSDALADLYRQFNSLKSELVGLTSKFDRVEAFADDLGGRRFTPPRRPEPLLHPRAAPRPAPRPQIRGSHRGHRPRVISIRRREASRTP